VEFCACAWMAKDIVVKAMARTKTPGLKGSGSQSVRRRNQSITPTAQKVRMAKRNGYLHDKLWALVLLDKKLGSADRVLPILKELPENGASVMLGGYQQDHSLILMADTRCRIGGRLVDGSGRLLLRHSCAGTRGASGAPLLINRGDRWHSNRGRRRSGSCRQRRYCSQRGRPIRFVAPIDRPV
jgi:hypothetical protein